VHQRWRQTASKEDVEYVSIQKEMALELVQSHLNVERVVAEKQVDDAPGGV
jgi:(2Fe-2S) ferredoxin